MEFIPFNYVKSCRSHREDKGVHFFVDDYQFERIWTRMTQNARSLIQFKGMLAPDFSLYYDWDTAVDRWNHYRKHFIAAYMQTLGMRVYPIIRWTYKQSYSWCFEGEPVGGCVAVSTVGTYGTKALRKVFIDGYHVMLERLKPTTIIFHGNMPKECEVEDIPIVQIPMLTEKYRTGGDETDED